MNQRRNVFFKRKYILLLTANTFRENREFVFIIIVPFMMSANTFWFKDGIRLFVHYTISLSSLCKLIWRHWTYKMPDRYILSSVWVRLSILSQLSIIQYVGLCVFGWTISLVMIERIDILCLINIRKPTRDITVNIFSARFCFYFRKVFFISARLVYFRKVKLYFRKVKLYFRRYL